MPFPNPDTQFKPGESGNPAGMKKGTKHLSTHIQEMLNDPDFELKLKTGEVLKGRPLEAIIKTAIAKGISGQVQWAEWLAKHGYGEKFQIEVSDPRLEILNRYNLGAESVRKTEEAESRPPTDSA